LASLSIALFHTGSRPDMDQLGENSTATSPTLWKANEGPVVEPHNYVMYHL
jgi:hypothetical protein